VNRRLDSPLIGDLDRPARIDCALN
jgi:hypothetical protein